MSYRGVFDYLTDRINYFGLYYATLGSVTLAVLSLAASTCKDFRNKVSSKASRERLEHRAD